MEQTTIATLTRVFDPMVESVVFQEGIFIAKLRLVQHSVDNVVEIDRPSKQPEFIVPVLV